MKFGTSRLIGGCFSVGLRWFSSRGNIFNSMFVKKRKLKIEPLQEDFKFYQRPMISLEKRAPHNEEQQKTMCRRVVRGILMCVALHDNNV